MSGRNKKQCLTEKGTEKIILKRTGHYCFSSLWTMAERGELKARG